MNLKLLYSDKGLPEVIPAARRSFDVIFMAFLLGPAVRCHQLRVSGCVSSVNGTFLCKRDSFRSGERRFCTSLQSPIHSIMTNVDIM